jgi:beta-galactosidase
LAAWVKKGGTLISEATPGYFGDRGKVGTVQPHNGLDAVFGVREADVEFMPDIGDRIAFDLNGKPVKGGGFLQAYKPTTGSAIGSFTDGRLAVVENQYGAGRTMIVGTHPGIAYFRKSNKENLDYFAEMLVWARRKQHVRLSNRLLHARLHEGSEGRVLWLLNPTRESQKATVSLADGAPVFGQAYWSGEGADVSGTTVTVPPRDVLIVRLTRS